MKPKMSCCYLLLLGFLFSQSLFGADAKKAKEIIQRVQKKYDALTSLKADFEQVYHWDLANETQKVRGKIYLQTGNKYRIETETQLIVTDGETVWTYSEPDQQVIVDLMSHSQENPLPRDLLFQYSEEYNPVEMQDEKLNGKAVYMIRLAPKDEEAFIRSMRVWIQKDNLFAVKIEQVDINDNINTYFIDHIEENMPLEAGLFQFQVPEGAEVIDLREND